MSHQDWNIISIGNLSKKTFEKEIVTKKGDTSVNDQLKKIENDNENFSFQKIPSALSKEIISIRNSLKLTQKDVSNKLNIQQNIYTELENGHAIYTNQTKNLVSKLEKVFGTKFKNK
jgi:ribosome-binding protein aMBF1 (putative translation factor)